MDVSGRQTRRADDGDANADTATLLADEAAIVHKAAVTIEEVYLRSCMTTDKLLV